MRPNNNRKHYNKNNNNNRYRKNNNNHGRHGGQRYDADSEFVTPQQKRHASNQQGKYQDLAKNARQNGDRVEAEYYLQHAEHYTRILNLADEQHQEREDAKAQERAEKQADNVAKHDDGDGNTDEQEEKSTRKRVVRKPRVPVAERADDGDDASAVESEEVEAKPKRRGRPKKTEAAESDSGATLQAVLPMAIPDAD